MNTHFYIHVDVWFYRRNTDFLLLHLFYYNMTRVSFVTA